MGTAVAKRTIWAVIAENPFPHFDAETFRAGAAARLQAYADRVGGDVIQPPIGADTGEIFRLQLADLPFPDGPGVASLDVVAYRAYGRLYLSLIVEHDRLFRSLDGSPGGRLYLHDFKFVRSYGGDGQPSLSEIDEALGGLERARTSVQARNRAAAGSRSPFARIRVAVRSETSLSVADDGTWDADPESGSRPQSPRNAVLDALEGRAAVKPPQVRIRRLEPRDGDTDDD